MNKLKLGTLPCHWYIPICAEGIPFSDPPNKNINIFLSRNSLHHNAQVIAPKKIDKWTKDILKKFNNLNQLCEYAESPVSCCYVNINRYKDN